MENNEKIMNKINGLLAKTVENGCTPEEAAAAAAKAQELMAKYHVEMRDCEATEEVCGCVEEYSRMWQAKLAHVICRNSCCKMIVHQGKPSRIGFMGKETDLQIVLALYDKLSAACLYGIRQEKSRCRETRGSAAGAENSYAAGFLWAVNEEMGKQCKALMLVVPSEVEDEFKKAFTHTGKVHTRRERINSDSYDRGYSDGRDATSRKAIAG